MKSSQLKRLIKESVREVIQEELKEILLEALKSPKQPIYETPHPPISPPFVPGDNPNFTPPKAGLYTFKLITGFEGNTSEDVVIVEAAGANELGGTLKTNTFLKNIEDNPDLADYFISTDLIVPEGITLTIGNNVTI